MAQDIKASLKRYNGVDFDNIKFPADDILMGDGRTVEEIINNKNLSTYSSVTQLGLIPGTVTLKQVIQALPVGSFMMFKGAEITDDDLPLYNIPNTYLDVEGAGAGVSYNKNIWSIEIFKINPELSSLLGDNGYSGYVLVRNTYRNIKSTYNDYGGSDYKLRFNYNSNTDSMYYSNWFLESISGLFDNYCIKSVSKYVTFTSNNLYHPFIIAGSYFTTNGSVRDVWLGEYGVDWFPFGAPYISYSASEINPSQEREQMNFILNFLGYYTDDTSVSNGTYRLYGRFYCKLLNGIPPSSGVPVTVPIIQTPDRNAFSGFTEDVNK